VIYFDVLRWAMDTNMDTKEVGSSLMCGLLCLSKSRPDFSEEEGLAVVVIAETFG
jgi:hypothetical protein